MSTSQTWTYIKCAQDGSEQPQEEEGGDDGKQEEPMEVEDEQDTKQEENTSPDDGGTEPQVIIMSGHNTWSWYVISRKIDRATSLA